MSLCGLETAGWDRKNEREMRTYEVKILGQRYKIRSDEGEDYIQTLADYLNEQLAEVQKGTRSVATHNVAILAALNITDNLFKSQEQKEKISTEVRDRIKKMLKLIRASQPSLGSDESS